MFSVRLDSVMQAGSNYPSNNVGGRYAETIRDLAARLRVDREVESLGAPNHLENRLAHRVMAGEQAVEVVDAGNRFLAQADHEVAFLESPALRRAAALHLDHAHAALARQIEMPHVAARDAHVLARHPDARAGHPPLGDEPAGDVARGVGAD